MIFDRVPAVPEELAGADGMVGELGVVHGWVPSAGWDLLCRALGARARAGRV
jgi:hypothetical protein